MSRTACVLAILAGISTLGACGRGHDLDDAALRAADVDSAEWLSYGRTYTEQRHSPLRQVDEQSVSRLGLAWSVDFQTLRGLEATPLVSDGVLYATSAWSVVYAIDAPGDSWDYDATQPITLADLTIEGRPRKVLMQPNKNAFFYVIDRETGTLISATPYASMTWATGMDANGRPIVNPAAKPSRRGTIVSPADYGGHNWYPTSFSPTTGWDVPERD